MSQRREIVKQRWDILRNALLNHKLETKATTSLFTTHKINEEIARITHKYSNHYIFVKCKEEQNISLSEVQSFDNTGS